MADKNILVGLDIGSTEVSVLIGEILPSNELNIIGVGNHKTKGMDKGGVNDLDSVTNSVKRAIEEAELMADCEISSVFLGISGKHISCRNEKGMVPISESDISQYDVDNAVHTAKSVKLPEDHRILHILPQEYAIDYQEGIKNPIGLSGVRMEAKVHLITCHNDMAKNIVKSVERCGLQVNQLIFSALASSYAVLTDDERELGVCLVDIGSGTMDIAVYTNGALRHTAVIPYAGSTITKDIAYAFGTPLNNAEEVKVRYGCASQSLINNEDTIEVPSVGGRPSQILPRKQLAEIIEPRYKDLMELVLEQLNTARDSLKQQGLKHQLAAGVVLTGGASQIEGLRKCAEKVLQCQVRIGKPINTTGLTEFVQSPVYSTAVGLLKYGKQNQRELVDDNNTTNNISNLINRFQSWFKGEF